MGPGLRAPGYGLVYVNQTLRLRPGLEPVAWSPKPYASDFFFSYCDSTETKSRGVADSTVTSCCIGACSTNSNFAYSSGLLGKAASSVTSAGLMARPCTTAALIETVGAVFRNVVSVLAIATASFSV